jgi:hypothetical protein
VTTAQGTLFDQLPPPQAAAPGAAREIVTTAQAAGVTRPRAHQGEPEPPDFDAFTVNPESHYADDEQEADALAAQCAVELKGYLFSAAMLELAAGKGKNPLIMNARAFTPKQLDELQKAVKEARGMAEWMLAECVDAFGEQDALRLYEYAQGCVDAVIKDAPADPEQHTLTF